MTSFLIHVYDCLFWWRHNQHCNHVKKLFQYFIYLLFLTIHTHSVLSRMTCDFTCTSWLTGTTLNTVQITVNINIIFELWRLQLMLGAGNCSFIYPSIFLSFPDWLKSNNNDWWCLALIIQWEKARFFGKIAVERHERWICASCTKWFRYCVNILWVKTKI